MREQLTTLPLSELKEMAKAKGLKGISSLRKAEIVDLLCRTDEGEGRAGTEEAAPKKEAAGRETAGKRKEEKKETLKPEEPAGEGGTAPTGEEKDAPRAAEEERKEPAKPQEEREPAKPEESVKVNPRKAENGDNGIRRDGQNGKRESGRESTGGRAGSRLEGKQVRVVNRYENRSYAGRGRSQEGTRVYRQQDGGSAGRSQETADRGQDGRGADRIQPAGQENNRSQAAVSSWETAARPAAEPAPIREAARPDGRNMEMSQDEIQELDSGMEANGILEVMPDGFGFIRCENFLPGDNDVYVAPSQIRRFNMKTGDVIRGNRRVKAATEKFAALLYVSSINGYPANVAERRPNFEDLTPIFPNQRIHMETPGMRNSLAMRILDLMAPIGKGQRGMIVSPPKAGKTTLLKQVAKAITTNQPNMHLIILLIDERPEEVTDIKEAIVGENVEVIYSTFDELPERHKRVSEMVIERARRLVEHGRDVTILLDSITRLARAYNLVVPPSGRTLSGGLDPAALHMPKRFFGAARNMREGGSLTILATALIDTGSRMDDVIYEEFKGTGNMELVLDRKLSERRIFPAIDILKSGTRRDDLLLSREEVEAMEIVRRATNSMKPEDSVEKILDLFSKTRTNREFVDEVRRRRHV